MAPDDHIATTDAASAGVHHQRTASDHVGTQDSASAVPGPPREPDPLLPSIEGQRHVQAIQEWLQRKWDHGPCPVCHTDQFGHGPLFEIPSYSPKVGPSVAVLPVFIVSCANCGYSLLFNALVAGIVPEYVMGSTLEDREAERQRS